MSPVQLIPPILSRLTALTSLDLSYTDNSLSGPIPSEISRLIALTALDLSHNNLSGPLPQLDNLANLNTLDLSHNSIADRIPPELGRLNKLSGLDLSYNSNLSGPIPPELDNLTSLNTLDLLFTNTSCERLSLSDVGQLNLLGLPCTPRGPLHQTKLYVTVSDNSEELDLSAFSETCKLVRIVGSQSQVRSIRFWGQRWLRSR